MRVCLFLNNWKNYRFNYIFARGFASSVKGSDLTKSRKLEQSIKRQKLKTKRPPFDSGFDLTCRAYCTGDSINIENFAKYSQAHYLVDKVDIDNNENVYSVYTKNESNKEKSAFVFPELGVFVTWKFNNSEQKNFQKLIQKCQEVTYDDKFINDEMESIEVSFENDSMTNLSNGKIFINKISENKLMEMVAISHAFALSVKLSVYEDMMLKLIKSILHVPENLKNGKSANFSRSEVLKKLGEIETLRLLVNLDSDFLYLNELYWDYDDLSVLFNEICLYFEVEERSRCLNQKLHHSNEIMDLLQRHLSEKHGHRLEWLIIILILAEVIIGLYDKL